MCVSVIFCFNLWSYKETRRVCLHTSRVQVNGNKKSLIESPPVSFSENPFGISITANVNESETFELAEPLDLKHIFSNTATGYQYFINVNLTCTNAGNELVDAFGLIGQMPNWLRLRGHPDDPGKLEISQVYLAFRLINRVS